MTVEAAAVGTTMTAMTGNGDYGTGRALRRTTATGVTMTDMTATAAAVMITTIMITTNGRGVAVALLKTKPAAAAVAAAEAAEAQKRWQWQRRGQTTIDKEQRKRRRGNSSGQEVPGTRRKMAAGTGGVGALPTAAAAAVMAYGERTEVRGSGYMVHVKN